MNARVAVLVALLVVVAGVPSLTASFPSGNHGDQPFRRDSGVAAVDVPFGFGTGIDHYQQGNPDGPVVRARRLHERGVTGEGVQVGVIGSSFDPDHPSIAAQVAGEQTFSTGGESRLAFDGAVHDTAVAEIVADTAPNASLYLATVGARPTTASYRRAVEWLIANGADVILDAGSYFPPSNENMAELNAVARNASRQGVVFVTSAGNYANHHWSKNVSTDGWVSFANDSQVNYLGDGPVSGRVSLRLYWTGSADFDLYLYRVRPDGRDDAVVAKSTEVQSEGGRNAESITVGVPRGRYYVAIYAHNETAPTALRLFSTHHSLSRTTATGSLVAPAGSEEVITVGAVGESGTLRRYSSRSKLLDVSAPDDVETDVAGAFRGTSSAAPYVAGTAALMASKNGDLGPDETERILERTARHRNGTARIDPVAAVEAAERLGSGSGRNATATSPTPTPTGTPEAGGKE